MARIITVCIIDDHDVVRQGLRHVFSLEKGFDVIGEAGSYSEALVLLDTLSPDLLLVDQMLGDGLGSALAEEILVKKEQLKIILLTAFPLSREKQKDLLRMGVKGVLFKDQSSVEIRRTVWELFGLKEGDDSQSLETKLESLSSREREILHLIAKGWLNKEISAEIGISDKTVRNTISNLFRKIGVGNRTEAARFLLNHNN